MVLGCPMATTVIYADWSAVKSHPKTLGSGDLDTVLGSGKLFARKFDDARVLDKIDERVHGERDERRGSPFLSSPRRPMSPVG